jgi:vacuolar protein sorting-associated protein 26
VALKIKSFTVSLTAQELMEAGGKTKKYKHILKTWEVTDGAPVKGEIIPFRLYLAPLNLSPSCSRAESGYTVTHFLHFSIITTSNEKYFKALQITLHKWTGSPFAFAEE